MTTLALALDAAVAQLQPGPSARQDAELLLLHVAGISRATLLTHPERTLDRSQLASYQRMIARRASNEPIQYITGVQEFYGRPFVVAPGVLIPRPETEHLVEAVLALQPRPLHILDIGTGSGILATTLALEIAGATLTATDLSPAALNIAAANAAGLGATRIRFLHSDLFASLPGEHFDCIVSNPPYVPAGELLEPQVRDYEPALALFAGDDGLAIYRRLIPHSLPSLVPGGHLLLEIGHGQRAAIAALLTEAGFTEVRFVNDLQAIPRIAIARRTANDRVD